MQASSLSKEIPNTYNKALKNEKKEAKPNFALRPFCFKDFPGQDETKSRLQVFVEAALQRKESLDHCLFSGPPGLGKTTLAHIIAQTMNVDFKATTGPAIRRKGDIAAILTTLKKGSILFIDEIHRLSKDIEEYLYSAMEDFYIDVLTGEGFGAKSIRFQLPPFTLIGATTRMGLLKSPFRDRFGIVESLSFYDDKALLSIVLRSALLLNILITREGAMEIAKRSLGTPRVANRLLKRVRDYSQVKKRAQIDLNITLKALKYLGVDSQGLESMHLKVLQSLQDYFKGGPAGINTLSSILGESTDTIEEFFEPYLITKGLIRKTSLGRVLTDFGKAYITKP